MLRRRQSTRMNYEAMLFMLAVVLSALLLFSMVFYIFMYEDLKSDYINPMDFANKLNQYVLWEYIGHAGLTLAFLLSLSWTAFFLNVPLLAFHANKVLNKKHLYDATNVVLTVKKHETEGLIKLAFYLLCFFYYLYRMILGLLEG